MRALIKIALAAAHTYWKSATSWLSRREPDLSGASIRKCRLQLIVVAQTSAAKHHIASDSQTAGQDRSCPLTCRAAHAGAEPAQAPFQAGAIRLVVSVAPLTLQSTDQKRQRKMVSGPPLGKIAPAP